MLEYKIISESNIFQARLFLRLDACNPACNSSIYDFAFDLHLFADLISICPRMSDYTDRIRIYTILCSTQSCKTFLITLIFLSCEIFIYIGKPITPKHFLNNKY